MRSLFCLWRPVSMATLCPLSLHIVFYQFINTISFYSHRLFFCFMMFPLSSHHNLQFVVMCRRCDDLLYSLCVLDWNNSVVSGKDNLINTLSLLNFFSNIHFFCVICSDWLFCCSGLLLLSEWTFSRFWDPASLLTMWVQTVKVKLPSVIIHSDHH